MWTGCGRQARKSGAPGSCAHTATLFGAHDQVEGCQPVDRRSVARIAKIIASGSKPAAIVEQLVDNSPLLHQALNETQAWLPSAHELSEILAGDQQRVPRIYAAAEALLQAVRYVSKLPA